MKHILDISHDCERFFPEPNEDPNKGVGEISALQELTV